MLPYSSTMQLTRFTHSCVRLESGGRVLVIDPGIWSEPQAFEGVDAFILTHEHADHVDVKRLARLDRPIYAPAGTRISELRTEEVAIGSVFEAAGFVIEALGGHHCSVIEEQPTCVNAGYVVDGLFYHSGDSLHLPPNPVQAALVPIQASWLKIADVIAFVNRLGASLAIGGHDAQLSQRGLAAANGWLRRECPTYRWLEPGQSVHLGTAKDQHSSASLT